MIDVTFAYPPVPQGAARPECDIDGEIAEEERKVQAILDEIEGDEPVVTAP